jgi:hypothetical protein
MLCSDDSMRINPCEVSNKAPGFAGFSEFEVIVNEARSSSDVDDLV